MTNSLEPMSHFGSDPTSTSPAWRWRLEDAAGQEVVVESVGDPAFPSQSEAETWVGEVWRDLRESGVDAVTLFEGDREVYGPMSLHA